MRRIVGALAGTLALVLMVLVAWDFIKPVRHVPPLVPAHSRATSILMEKQARQLTLFHGDKVIKTFRVALGGDPIGTETARRRQPHAGGRLQHR